MAFELRSVDGLVHAFENRKIYRVLERSSGNRIQDSLNLEATFDRGDIDSEVLDERTELAKFSPLGRRMDTVQIVQL